MQIFFTASTVSFIAYMLFFRFAAFFRSLNIILPMSEITPWIRGYIGERDGVEGYVLYAMMFLNIALTYAVAEFLLKRINKDVEKIFYFIAVVCSVVYLFDIQFIPPFNSFLWIQTNMPGFIIKAIITGAAVALMAVIQKYNSLLLDGILFVILIPVCFIATMPYSINDYSYIFSPAYRLLEGVKFENIYFQYDIMLSLIAALWMKAGISVDYFQVLGGASVFVFLFCSYLLSKKMFNNKHLPLFFAVTLIIVRVYANIMDPSTVFQVTPLRLDWWLLILAAAFFAGPEHIATGISIGFLLMLSKTWGIIYFASYCFMILILFVAELSGETKQKMPLLKHVHRLFLVYAKKYLPNFLIITGFYIAGRIIFNKPGMEAAGRYSSLGIGFLPISENSFYWYFPVIFSSLVCLLIKIRDKISEKYFAASLLLVCLAIGNSVYFFGRSHEHNIINISGSLIFVVYILIDVILKTGEEGIKGRIWVFMKWALPAAVVFLAILYYPQQVSDKITKQYTNAVSGKFIYRYEFPISSLDIIKKETGNSDKVFFMGGVCDFCYYYYGHYYMEGYNNPFGTWIFMKDITAFLQGLLDRQYWLIAEKPDELKEIFAGLRFDTVIVNNGLAFYRLSGKK